MTTVRPGTAVVLLRSWQRQVQPSRSPAWLRDAPPMVAVAIALAGWFAPLGDINLRSMSSIGLLSVLPVPSLVALGLLCVSFCLELRRAHPRGSILLVHVIALLLMVYALPAVVETEPRFSVTWRHVGIIQTIQHTRGLDPTIDAYFNWPGFFAASAFVERVAGVHTVISGLTWAPFVFELLSLPPLLMIMRALTSGVRLRWMAVWCFYLANWVGQDYFSPQAFAYVLYLILLAAVVVWLREPARWRPPWARLRAVADRERSVQALSPPARAALVAMVIFMVAAVVASHQLTPFALLPGLSALVLLRRCSARGLPLLIALFIATWMSYLAVAYLAGHFSKLLANVGQLGSIVNESVAGRVQGANGHLVVTSAQLVLAGGLWSMAALGAIRRARRGHDDLTPMALGAGAFVLPVLQPYGGEIVLRMFLFSLPFTAFFTSALFITPSTAGRSLAVAATLAAVCVALAGGQLLVRYGNEQMDWFSPAEVSAVEQLYRVAPPGSALVSWSTSLPWKFRDYAEHHYRVITDNPAWSRPADLPAGSPAQLAALAGLMRGERRGAFLILTRSQAAQVGLVGLGRPGTVQRVWRAVASSRAFRVLYSNPDGIVATVVRKGRNG